MPSAKTWRLIASILLAFVLVLLGAWMAGLIPAEGQYCEHNPYSDHETCTFHQMPIVWIRYIGWALDASAPALTVIATFVIGAFTYALWRSTDKLWDAGERQLDHLEKTAQRRLRAYVAVRGIVRTQAPGASNRVFEARVDVMNCGQTPAYDFTQWTSIDIKEFPLKTELQAQQWSHPSKTMLGPNSPAGTVVKLGGELEDADIAALQMSRGAIYVWGEIGYRDAFKRPRYTRFRFRCNGVGFRDGFFMPCEEGNDAN